MSTGKQSKALYVLDARTASHHFPGIGRYVFNLARAMLPLLENDQKLILLHDPSQSSPWELPELIGIEVEVVDLPLSPFALRQQWLIPGLLQRLKADVYHSPYYLMPYWPGVSTVLTIYDLIPLLYPHYSSARARMIFRWATALALRAARQIVVISEATRCDLLAIYPLSAKRVTPIPLAAAPIFKPASSQAEADIRSRLNLPERYALYLGSNKPHKNLVRLVEAWARLQPQPFALLIAGAWDPRYPQARQQAEALALGQAIQFLGPVADRDLPALYSGAIFFVFPSEYEGFGLPVLEAMACGTPVACSNTASLPEVAGDAALMFDPTQVDDIARALASALSDAELRTDLRERGLRRAAHFTWERTAWETLKVYKELTA
jgi:alpha-1,3-rhamnosyl/mannosyltransferase